MCHCRYAYTIKVNRAQLKLFGANHRQTGPIWVNQVNQGQWWPVWANQAQWAPIRPNQDNWTDRGPLGPDWAISVQLGPMHFHYIYLTQCQLTPFIPFIFAVHMAMRSTMSNMSNLYISINESALKQISQLT